MTLKVIKGSLWTLLGQFLPLLASFITTPFVIRLLGAERYGVFILVGLIPTYFSFTDLGMGLASTKFGSEAYGQGLRKREGEVIRTAALVAAAASLPFALSMFCFSLQIAEWLKVQESLRPEASLALKVTSGTFIINILNGVLNTPQLSRLRMDLNAFITISTRVLGTVATPLILLIGGGIVGASLALMASSILALFGHLIISGRLLGELFECSIDATILKPLLKFGSTLVVSNIAASLLVNLEKIVLAKTVSIESLAYYSVAFTLANMATMFSASMVQSLLPAFSQLLGPERRAALSALFSRSLRLNIISLIPLIIFLAAIAKPFFTVWAGEKFGQNSSAPFYFLLLGIFFNVIAYVPHSVLMASGRAEVFAKLYWIELLPYTVVIAALTYRFGAIGAAAAWSLRVIVDATVLLWLAEKLVGLSLKGLKGISYILVFLLLTALSVLLTLFIGSHSSWLVWVSVACFALYGYIAWSKLLEDEERNWLSSRLPRFNSWPRAGG